MAKINVCWDCGTTDDLIETDLGFTCYSCYCAFHNISHQEAEIEDNECIKTSIFNRPYVSIEYEKKNKSRKTIFDAYGVS